MKALGKVTFQNQAYEHLKKAILDGEIKESVIYSENSFANILGVSRTPVREAVLKLKQEGLLETLPSRGLIIKTITSEEIVEIFGYRKALEGFAVMRLAESSGTEEGRSILNVIRLKLDEQRDIVEKSGSLYEAMRIDNEFHREIINFTGYKQIISQMQSLSARIYKIGIKSFNTPGRFEQSIKEHREILERMEKGDCFAAFRALQDHLDHAEKLMIESME